MTVLRRLARPLLASIFFPGAYGAFQHPGPRAAMASRTIDRIREALPVDLDADAVVRLNAALQLGAATTLALGKAPRLSAAVLVASLVPTTLGGHAFWQETEPASKAHSRLQFFKNLSTIGGLLLAVADTEGKPSLAWRGRHLAGQSRHAVRASRREARLAARAAGLPVRHALLG